MYIYIVYLGLLRIISILQMVSHLGSRFSWPWPSHRGGRYDGLLASYMLDITVEVVKMKDSEAAGEEIFGRNWRKHR
jgi:hypothetical protein